MSNILETLDILNNICEDCTYYKTEECNNKKCLIGYAKRLLEFSKSKGVMQIEGASKLIPNNDLKYYDEDLVCSGIANTCKHCKNCQENHNEDCIIAVLRKCLENTVITKNIPYKGSVFMYLMDLNKENKDIAQIVNMKLKK
ncbi:hypothetical protein [Tepidibacter formicigenes]|jgi:hypothetical protein|uniref:Uncharacterized protein n=1 Tax=Tepidibacter formicigenes DSM 15518 TaxID=1123349 RepID=A0A1M6RF95_9FIRM|nr:hypothetical protein [Tepidibacter formicigenes]SHK31132.1 hypothetical protein SAMN02744037_02096 [Tepidibacter formicigenes DSM 15518]